MQHNDQNTKHRGSALSCSEYLKYWKQNSIIPIRIISILGNAEIFVILILAKRQKDNLNGSRGSQARWELDGLPTQITLDRRLYNWSALIHANMIHKSFYFSHEYNANRNTQYHSLSDSSPKKYHSLSVAWSMLAK